MEKATVNISRMKDRLANLGKIGALRGGGVRRLALTDEDREARNLFIHWLEECGAEVKVDQIGNTFGFRGDPEKKAPVMVGSHLDTVTTGGLYDGSLGVLVGLEILEILQEKNLQTNRPFAVVNFTNEEGVRFAPGMMGSKAFSGSTPIDELLTVQSVNGQTTVGEELKRIGFDREMECGSFDVHRFLELHIEQGPVLENEKKQIGIVKSVQGIYWTEYTIKGESGHAGTTPLNMRRDAGFAAAEITGFIRRLTEELGGVGTVGFQELKPNATNVIPELARMRIDFRHPDEDRLKEGQQRMDDFVAEACRKENTEFEKKELIRVSPVQFDAVVTDLMEKTAEELGYSSRRMPSGAGHDARMMADVCPTAMIFVPSRNGISHNINEFTADRHIEAGANVMLNTVVKMLQR